MAAQHLRDKQVNKYKRKRERGVVTQTKDILPWLRAGQGRAVKLQTSRRFVSSFPALMGWAGEVKFLLSVKITLQLY